MQEIFQQYYGHFNHTLFVLNKVSFSPLDKTRFNVIQFIILKKTYICYTIAVYEFDEQNQRLSFFK